MNRRIAVAVTGSEADTAVLDWTAGDASPGDEIHVVYPYALLDLPESAWPPAVRANEERRTHAHRVVTAAVSRLRMTTAGVTVDGSAVPDPPISVETDVSTLTDLLVVAGGTGSNAHAIARRASCPVVVVPPLPPRRAITERDPVVLLIDGSSLPADAVQFAFEEAHRHATELVVAECRTSAPSDLPVNDDDVSYWDRSAQEILAADLAVWQQKYADAGVILEVRHETSAVAAMLLHHSSRLLVVSRASGDVPLDQLVRDALDRASRPVAVVPEQTFAAADRRAVR